MNKRNPCDVCSRHNNGENCENCIFDRYNCGRECHNRDCFCNYEDSCVLGLEKDCKASTGYCDVLDDANAEDESEGEK